MQVDDLVAAGSDFNRAHVHVAFRLADRVARYAVWRLAATGADVTSTVEFLAEGYEEAHATLRASRSESRAQLEVLERAGPRLVSSFKHVYISVRAYQDAVCGVMHELQGSPAGAYKSMHENGLKKETHPISILLADAEPAYREWFYEWKKIRDAMKVGAQFSVEFDERNVTISFVHPFNGGMRISREKIGLADVVAGLAMTVRLLEVVDAMIDEAPASALQA